MDTPGAGTLPLITDTLYLASAKDGLYYAAILLCLLFAAVMIFCASLRYGLANIIMADMPSLSARQAVSLSRHHMRGRKWFFIRLMFPYTTPLVLALPVYTLVITVASTVLGGSQLSGFITAATLLMMASAFMLTLLINITGCRFYKHFADIREEALHQSHWLKDPQAAESALQEIPDPASTAVQAPDSGAS